MKRAIKFDTENPLVGCLWERECKRNAVIALASNVEINAETARFQRACESPLDGIDIDVHACACFVA